MESSDRIFVAGHTGLLGSALVRRLRAQGFDNLTLVARKDLDLRDQARTFDFLAREKPSHVFACAARVGGIRANIEYPADFLYDNLAIAANLVEGARRAGVGKLLFPSSNCVYPSGWEGPIPESALLTGPVEPTNEPYAVAKIAGMKLCQTYARQHGLRSVVAVAASLYGPGAHLDESGSHFVAGLMSRVHSAKLERRKEVPIWGTGTALRELLYVDDCADALILLMRTYEGREPVNVGSGDERTVVDIAGRIAAAVGHGARFVPDPSRPEGIHRKLLDSTRIRALGWRPATPLDTGLARTYEDFFSRYATH